ncbi:carbon-nitrogen hydrolase family protein [soil metagenome]
MTVRFGAVQMNTVDDKERNVERAVELIGRAAAAGAHVVGLPENFNFLGPLSEQRANAEPIPGPTTERMRAAAAEHGIHLLAGSILEVPDNPDAAGRVYNTSVLFGPDGGEIARYRKVHLFDIEVGDRVSSRESDIMLPGGDLVVASAPGGPIGLTICFDLRFPELYRSLALRGARVVFCPAAFTLYTGKDHWELLLRARAVENAMYVVAPAQIGAYPPDGRTFGSAMIVDPWGTVIARAPEHDSVVVAEVDEAWQDEVRKSIPSLTVRRPDVYDL